MKPEPLNGKELQGLAEPSGQFEKEDIRSAVEWLRSQLPVTFNQPHAKHALETAFEDVME